MCAKCAGRINLDSIKEKIKHKITTIPMVFQMTLVGPLTINMGEKAAIVVNTPKVAGIATLLTPRITDSVL